MGDLGGKIGNLRTIGVEPFKVRLKPNVTEQMMESICYEYALWRPQSVKTVKLIRLWDTDEGGLRYYRYLLRAWAFIDEDQYEVPLLWLDYDTHSLPNNVLMVVAADRLMRY